ncbi:MAG TPA: porin [Gemmatimonadales bacterium]|nr:porin [Gemmatimonadales bacterium]
MAAERLGLGLSLALAWTLVQAAPASPQAIHVTGYGSVEFLSQQGSKATFDAHNLNLILVGKLRNHLFAAAEVEYEHGGEEIALEFAYLAFTRIRYLNLIAGKFIVPFGSFNVNHPAFINKVPGRPFGFDRVIPVTYNDVGVMVRGGLPTGRLTRVTYDAWAVNGLAGDPGGDLRGMRDNNIDVDGSKFFGGRLGFVGPHGFDIGASVHTGVYNDENDLRVTLFGVDATFQHSGFELKGEFVQANQQTTAEDLKKRGFYGQASYLATTWFEPTVRFSQMDFPGESNRDLREVSLGASFYPSDFGALRIFYRVNKERSVTEVKDNLFIAQFTVGF